MILMTKYNAKTILFALLIAAMILPFSMMDTASAAKQSQAIYDLDMVNYIEELISSPGKNNEQKVIDGQTISVTTKTKQLSDTAYKVKTVTTIDGVVAISETFKIKIHDDSTYTLKNKNLEIDERFTDEASRVNRGSGNSDTSGARIDLHDKEYGTPHTLTLNDNYSGCGVLNQAHFQAVIGPNTVDVNWEAHPIYAHWCFVPFLFDHGSVQYGTNTIQLDGQSDRRGSYAFTNYDVGTTWYSVEVDFVYGSW